MNAAHMADMLEVELSDAGVPRAFHCEVLSAVEGWFRYLKGRGTVIQRVGFTIALEAVKLARKRHCPDVEEDDAEVR